MAHLGISMGHDLGATLAASRAAAPSGKGASTASTASTRRLYGGGPDRAVHGGGGAEEDAKKIYTEAEGTKKFDDGKAEGKKEGAKPITHAVGYTSAIVASMLLGTSLGVWHENATKGKQIKALQQQLQQSAN